jgi:hypothetical protein
VRWLTAALTRGNDGTLEQRRWHATSDHGGDAALGHGSEAVMRWTVTIGSGVRLRTGCRGGAASDRAQSAVAFMARARRASMSARRSAWCQVEAAC